MQRGDPVGQRAGSRVGVCSRRRAASGCRSDRSSSGPRRTGLRRVHSAGGDRADGKAGLRAWRPEGPRRSSLFRGEGAIDEPAASPARSGCARRRPSSAPRLPRWPAQLRASANCVAEEGPPVPLCPPPGLWLLCPTTIVGRTDRDAAHPKFGGTGGLDTVPGHQGAWQG